MAALRLLAIGDIAWDIFVRPSAEFVWGSDVYGSVDLLPGGSSANVAVWGRRLGARATLVGTIGDDRLGDLMLAHLEAERVSAGVTRLAGRQTTRIGLLVRPDGEHAFVTDHSNPLRLTPNDLPYDLLDEADVVFLNGYAVFMAGGAGFASAFLGEARRREVPIAFDPSSFALVRKYGGERLLDELGRVDVLLANEEEVAALTGRGVESLFDRSPLIVVKQGGRGATACQPAEGTAAPRRVTSPAVRVEAVDTTGAGDAFDAAFLVDYFTHHDLTVALAAANMLGARVASRVGAQTLE